MRLNQSQLESHNLRCSLFGSKVYSTEDDFIDACDRYAGKKKVRFFADLVGMRLTINYRNGRVVSEFIIEEVV